MDRKRELLLRTYILLVIFLAVAVFMFVRAFKISVIEGDKWRAKGDSLYIQFRPIEAERGNILSKEGNLLATSLQFFDIHMDLNSTAMTDEVFREGVDSLAICLSKYVQPDKTAQQIKNELIRERRKGSRYHLIKRNATYDELRRMKTFPIFRLGQYKGGFIVERRSRREKPYHSLASRTIGRIHEHRPSVGLEEYFDEELSGEKGRRLMQRVARNTWIPVNDLTEIEPVRGHDLVSTLDMEIQDIAHHALLGALERHKAEYGVALVMEVETGAIRAMANLSQVRGGYAEIFNHAVGSAVEPGSTMKLASIMALMEDGLIDLGDPVQLHRGKTRICGNILRDAHRHSLTDTTVLQAFRMSSNVGMAGLAQENYGDRQRATQFIKRLKHFRLDQQTGIEITGEAEPFIRTVEDSLWSCMSAPWMSIGYEVKLSPLQLLNFYNSVANGGKMMKPRLVSEIRDGTKVIERFEPEVLRSRIASGKTIARAQYLLEEVVGEGTASDLQTPLYSFAGKTGTAVINYSTDESRKRYQASFVGYFPAENPVYSCIVVVRDPRKNGYYGGSVAGPVFREIADKCFLSKPELHPTVQSKEEDGPEAVRASIDKMPLYRPAYRKDLESVFDFVGIPYKSKTSNDWAVPLPGEDTVELAMRSIPKSTVPDVKGMSLRDALYLLENAGLSVEVQGSAGKVVYQSVETNTPLEAVNRIRIQLE